jgi:hypothetical protein
MVSKSKSKRFTPVERVRNAAKSKPSNSGIFQSPQKATPASGDGHARKVLDYAVNHHKSTSAKVNSR